MEPRGMLGGFKEEDEEDEAGWSIHMIFMGKIHSLIFILDQ